MTFTGNAGCFKKQCNDIPNVTVWRVLRKRLHLKTYKLSIVEHFERWIICTSLSWNVFVTLATQYNLEYYGKALFETLWITQSYGIRIAQLVYRDGLRAGWAGNILSSTVHPGSGTHQIPHPMGKVGSFPVGKAAETWSSLLSGDEVQEGVTLISPLSNSFYWIHIRNLFLKRMAHKPKPTILYSFAAGVYVLIRAVLRCVRHNLIGFRGFRPKQLYFNSCLLFYSNYLLHVSVIQPSSIGNTYIGN
jgi:hypothetical protein